MKKEQFYILVIFIFSFHFHLISSGINSFNSSESYLFDNYDKILKEIKKYNLAFLQNKGQYPKNIKFYSRINNAELFFTQNGIKFITSFDTDQDETLLTINNKKYYCFDMQLIKPKNDVIIIGEDEISTKTNIFRGNDSLQWRKNLSKYKKIRYKNIFDNIDLIYYTQSDNIKYDFYLKPFANIRNIKFKYNGFSSISINDNGELVLDYKYGKIIEAKPKMYQIINGNEICINGKYTIDKNNIISFTVDNYYPEYPLIIDPELKYSTYFGGSGDEKTVNGFVVLNNGDIVITGMTNSTYFFPTETGYDLSLNGSQDIFLFKFNNNLSEVKSATYLGGSLNDGYINIGAPIALMPNGNIVITGFTNSSDFPTTNEVFVGGNNYSGSGDMFITIFNSNLTDIVASSYLGGSGADYGQAVTVDESSNIYIGGTSTSTNFPHFSNSYQTTNKGGYDITISKYNSNLSSLLASTYIGGSGTTELPWDIIYINNSIYLTGGTTSNDFPTTAGSYDQTFNGDRDVFIIRFNTSLSTLLASTYIGSPEYEQALGITSDTEGNIYIVGDCRSGNYPTTSNAYDKTYSGTSEIFISKLDPNLSRLLASTLLGGSGSESARTIKVRDNGEVVIGGSSTSDDYPISFNSIQNTYKGNGDGVISFLSNDLSNISFSTFFGGSAEDDIQCISFIGDNLFFAGNTKSADFPTTSGSYDISYNGLSDAFISCIYFGTAINPPNLIFPLNNSTNINSNVNFIWSSVNDAINYRLQISTDSIFNIIILDTLTNQTRITKLLLNNTKYYWKVASQSLTGEFTWSNIWNFTTQSTSQLSPPVLISPLNSSTNIQSPVNLIWSSVSEANIYIIYVSLDTLFQNVVVIDSTENTSYYLSNLNSGTKYFWKVLAKNNFNTSPYSQIWSFTTIFSQLQKPQLLSPPNNSTDLPIAFLIGWNSVPGATEYHLQVSTDSSFNFIIVNDSTLTTTERVLSQLINNKKYFWRVRAKNFSSISSWSDIWNFTTIKINLDKTKLILPFDKSTDLQYPIAFIWNKVPNATFYSFQLAEDSVFNLLIRDDTINTDTITIVQSLKNNTKYFWRVKAFSELGDGPWSDIYNFVTIVSAPSKPRNLYPLNNSQNIDIPTIISWSSEYENGLFELQLSLEPNFDNIYKTFIIENTTTINITNLNKSTTYYWRVKVYYDGLYSEWSDIWSFTTINYSNIIKDPKLEQKIREELNKFEGEITFSDLQNLTKLFAEYSDINDLSGIEYATNLTYLSLKYNNISEINPLTQLENLEYLDISNNKISNLRDFSKLDKLLHLNLDYNNLIKIDSLSVLHSLVFLSFIGNNIDDLYPISNLSSLDTLLANENNITELPNQINIQRLNVLGLSYNNISDITPISSLQNLQMLLLDHNKIENINALANLTKIEDISLQSNELSEDDLPNLYNMKSLSNQNIKTDLNGNYYYGYLDLRYNKDITRISVMKLDSALPKIDYAHILWDSLDNIVKIEGEIKKDFTPIQNVQIIITGTENKTLFSDIEGKYNVYVEKGGDYLITPFKENLAFIPPSYSIKNLLKDTVLNFTVNEKPTIEINKNKITFSAIQNGQKPQDQTFHISNSGSGILKWKITNTDSWLSVSPTSGEESSVITVSILTTNLNPGLYKTELIISDTNATNSPQKVNVEYNLLKITLPSLQFTSLNSAELNTDYKIEFSLKNGDIPDQVNLYYRIGGNLIYDSLSVPGINGNYVAIIPKEKITINGLNYYIKLFYGKEEIILKKNQQDNYSITTNIPQLKFPQKLNRKVYSLLSSFDFNNGSIYSELVRNFGEYSSKVWKAFVWNNNNFEEILDNTKNIGKGKGFWLITNTDKNQLEFQNLLSTPTGEPFKIDLLPGWNQIGNPFIFTVSIKDIDIPPEVEKIFWKYDENIKNYLIEENQIEPYHGYFIRNNSINQKSIIINPIANNILFSTNQYLNSEWVISLNISTENFEIEYLRFGTKSNSNNNKFYNVGISPELPINDKYPKVFFKTLNENKRLSWDFKEVNDSGYLWIIELDNFNKGDIIKFTFNLEGHFPSNYLLNFSYSGNSIIRDIRNEKVIINIKKNDDNTIILKVGSKEFIDKQDEKYHTNIKPYILFQNYPNPFNPETNISFYLPKDDNVKLSIFNVLGEEISILLNKKLSMGEYNVKFEPKNNLPSGIYFYKLETSSFTSIKKMVYIR